MPAEEPEIAVFALLGGGVVGVNATDLTCWLTLVMLTQCERPKGQYNHSIPT